jgi:L-alanine-DL-glutamate epimerase-like enolase superfamily enzyme
VELLGGTPGRLRTYASSMRRDITPQDEAERFCASCATSSASTPSSSASARECGRDIDEWPGRTEAIVPAMRQALGPDVALMVDANRLFAARAIEVGRLLQDHGVSHFEEPCPYWELEQTQQVTRRRCRSMSPAASRTGTSPPGGA